MSNLRELLGEAYKDGMTFEEIETALVGKKLADLSNGDYVSKGKLSDYEKRMKEAEKKLAEKLTDDEKRQVEMEKREAYYKALERENSLHKYTVKLSKTIKDEAVLNEVANLYADGEFSKAIDKQNEYLAVQYSEMEKTIKSQLLKEQPTPQAEKGNKTMTREQFRALPLQEKQKIASDNPELYKKLTN